MLWLTIDGIRALFGAALDEHDTGMGWSALMTEQREKPWIQGASLVKVPHHGSSRAHCPELYRERCADPVAVIASNWSSNLSDEGTVDRLGGMCQQIYHTSARNKDRDRNRDDLSSNVHAPAGAVTARRRPGENQWRATHRSSAWQEHPTDPLWVPKTRSWPVWPHESNALMASWRRRLRASLSRSNAKAAS